MLKNAVASGPPGQGSAAQAWHGAMPANAALPAASRALPDLPGLSILLVDDHALFRSGMRLVLLAGLPQVEVLEASSIEQAVRAAAAPPALVLLDIQLQGVNGLEGLGLFRQRWPGVPVVMLSSAAEPETVRLALSRGAAAFVSKADTAEKIIQVIEQVLGGTLPDPNADMAHGMLAHDMPRPRLTPRQCEVLDLLCEGLSNKVIARRLELSEFTVRGHVQAVLGLLGVSSRSQVMLAARRSGLIG
ncbi:MAG: two component transcriptional regulator, LuxR family [Polaromonas sp.]|nr:two component transcriptional regulator, LuxR family [Polaromonas sp.]